MIFEIITAVTCILLFLYIRHLHIIIADLSKECIEEFESVKSEQKLIINGFNNVIKKFKSFSQKVVNEFKNLRRDVMVGDRMKDKKHFTNFPTTETPKSPPIAENFVKK